MVVFQKRGMSCRAADKKKRNRHLFWEAIDPGSMERNLSQGSVAKILQIFYLISEIPVSRRVKFGHTPTRHEGKCPWLHCISSRRLR